MKMDLETLKWSDLKIYIRQRWNRLTDDDLSSLDGDTEEFISLLRRRYGYGKVQAEIEINNWLNSIESRTRKNNK